MTNEERAIELFNSNFNCSQAVYLSCRDKSLMSQKAAILSSGAFGGGVGGLGQTCGALCGAMMVLSERFTPEEPSDLEQKQRSRTIMKAFGKWFEDAFGTCLCLDLRATVPPGVSSHPLCTRFVAGCAKKLSEAMAPFSCRPVEYGSLAYEKELYLRQVVLRDALGLTLKDEDLRHEIDCVHFGAFILDELVATLYLQPLDEQNVQLRQVAVRDDYQRMGAGRILLGFAEDYARKKGYKTIHAHARKTAQAFYEALDYRVIGQADICLGLPHEQMGKALDE